MRPVTGQDPEARDPVHRPAAERAVKYELPELAFEIALHLQELLPQHLCVKRDRVRTIEAGINGLVDERARSGGTCAYGLDRTLKDATLRLHQLG